MDPALLWSRALLLGVLTTFLGVAGHVTADGLLPGVTVLALVLATAVGLSVPLLARPASTRLLVVLLVAGQAAVHVVLSATAGHRGDGPGPAVHRDASGAVGHLPVVSGQRLGSLQEAYDGGSVPTTPGLPVDHLLADLASHAPMMAVHLLAAALVGLWLAVGERSLWTLLALAARVLLAPLVVVRALSRAGLPRWVRPARPRPAPAPRRTVLLARCVVRRGPPLLAD